MVIGCLSVGFGCSQLDMHLRCCYCCGQAAETGMLHALFEHDSDGLVSCKGADKSAQFSRRAPRTHRIVHTASRVECKLHDVVPNAHDSGVEMVLRSSEHAVAGKS